MIVKFNLEGRDEGAAFFALYAGLRMYKEQKDKQTILLNETKDDIEKTFSIPAAEASCMMQDLREKFPKQYEEAKQEFEEVYAKI
jgi:hypothetical protein